MARTGLTCIVVHHDSYSTVADTVDLLVHDGISRSEILVVDNSEEPERRAELEASLKGVEVLYVENRGYGAAVNAGVGHLRSNGRVPEFVLVATHEVRPRAGTVPTLTAALRSDPAVGAAGPTLLVGGEGSTCVWSCGGGRTERLHAHQHVGPALALDQIVTLPTEERLWLDGAFVLYRAEVLWEMGFDERYFMYMEETDLHYRMQAAGWTCLWVPQAVVWQSTGLTPPFYFGRNIKLFFRKNEDPVRAMLAPPVLVGRDVLRRLRHRDVVGARESLRGFLTRVG